MLAKRQVGFTLIEVLIVVVIVAILASIALPSYQNSVRKSRRADGMAALSNIQMAQEKLRANCRFFGQNIGAGANVCGASAADSTIGAATVSPDGHYAITLSNATATSFTATATGQGDQANDAERGATCTLVLTVNAANPNGLRTPADCWD